MLFIFIFNFGQKRSEMPVKTTKEQQKKKKKEMGTVHLNSLYCLKIRPVRSGTGIDPLSSGSPQAKMIAPPTKFHCKTRYNPNAFFAIQKPPSAQGWAASNMIKHHN